METVELVDSEVNADLVSSVKTQLNTMQNTLRNSELG